MDCLCTCDVDVDSHGVWIVYVLVHFAAVIFFSIIAILLFLPMAFLLQTTYVMSVCALTSNNHIIYVAEDMSM